MYRATPQVVSSINHAGRASGKWTIHMTRRINKSDGSFGGIVSMAVDPGYFTSFL